MRSNWWTIPAIVAPVAICAPAYAVQYLSVEQAQAVLFPGADRFQRLAVSLSRGQRDAVEDYAGVRMRFDNQPVWQAFEEELSVGWFVVDEVYGKHEFITYAVGLTPEGVVDGVEILEYREAHGGEVQRADWLAQFQGRQFGEGLKLGDDIANISGATLSCKHITEGVRRILALYHAALKP